MEENKTINVIITQGKLYIKIKFFKKNNKWWKN